MNKYYIIYEYDKEKNDITNRMESQNREEIASWLGVRVDNLSKSIAKTIEELPRLIKDKYFVMIDRED